MPQNDGGQLPPLDGKITPDDSSIIVTGQPVDVPFHFKLADGSEPRVVWIADDTRIGSIGPDGVFRANGYVGGVVTITASTGSGQSTTHITVNVDITDNPIGLPPADQGALVAGGTGDAAFSGSTPTTRRSFREVCRRPRYVRRRRANDLPQSRAVFQLPAVAYGGSTRVTIRDPVWHGNSHRGTERRQRQVMAGGGLIWVRQSHGSSRASLRASCTTPRTNLRSPRKRRHNERPAGQNAQVVLQLAVAPAATR